MTQPYPICGGRGEHVPPCSEVSALRQFPSVEQLYQQRDRPAGVTMARLKHPDVAPPVVAEPQTRGKAGLRETGPLADGFDLGRAHARFMTMSDTTLSERSRATTHSSSADCQAAHFSTFSASATQASLAWFMRLRAFASCFHAHITEAFSRAFIFSLHAGGAGPLADDLHIGTVFLSGKHNPTRFVANIETTPTGDQS